MSLSDLHVFDWKYVLKCVLYGMPKVELRVRELNEDEALLEAHLRIMQYGIELRAPSVDGPDVLVRAVRGLRILTTKLANN